MTGSQLKGLYFPAWRRVCEANGWAMEKGRLRVDEDRLTDDGRKVLELAREAACSGHHRAPVLDDIRHAAHRIALGRDRSSRDLTNAELDRVLAVFRVLIDPEDIAAGMAWRAYEGGDDPGAVKRLRWRIRRSAPLAYIDRICRDKFAGCYTSPRWEDLPLAALRQLSLTLRERGRRRDLHHATARAEERFRP